jgi:N-acetyl sugar amidotransferase
MRILFIVPLPEPTTGMSLACKVLLDRIPHDHQIDLVDLSKREFKQGINSIERLAGVFRILWRVWRTRKPADVIYFTVSESIAGNLKDLLIYVLCLRQLAHMVIHLHGGASMRSQILRKGSLLRAVNALFLRRLGGVIILGESQLDIYSGIVPRNRIHIVPNFAEDHLFVRTENIARKFEDTNPLRLLFLSNMLQGKGHLELLEAFFGLDEQMKASIRIDFAGGFESPKDQTRFLARIAGEGRIRYHGTVAGERKTELLQQAHVFCLPTYYAHEGQPISILEAYASGCAVITTDHSGIRDVFRHETNGLEVAKMSTTDLRTAITTAVAEPERLRRMATTNLKAALENYRTSEYSKKLLSIIDAAARPPIVRVNERSSHRQVARAADAGKKSMYEERTYRVCENCIMNETDANITFDTRGWCDYCNNYYKTILPAWHTDDRGTKILAKMADKIKRAGREREHDCLIGLSGGVDSSYVTYVAKQQLGLRPLLLHVDTGWNSQEAANNIERLVDGLGVDLHTEVVNWREMQDLQLAFFRAQVPHLDTPQDHAIFAGLYNFAAKHGFKYILTGANYSTECVREPLEWHYHASDLRQIKDIHRQFGTVPLRTFPTADIFRYRLYYRFIKGVRVVRPLNHFPFVKEDAMKELSERLGWQRYSHKHFESRFTRFYEGYWLPTKFGYDKRRAHFSSLIVTGQMTRAEALRQIARPAYDEATIAHDFEYVATKLDVSVAELQRLMNGPNKSYRDYKNNMTFIRAGTRLLRTLGLQKTIIR